MPNYNGFFVEFCENRLNMFFVILLTNKQTNAGENTIFLAHVTRSIRTRRTQKSDNATDPEKFSQLPPSRSGKNSWIWIITKIE